MDYNHLGQELGQLFDAQAQQQQAQIQQIHQLLNPPAANDHIMQLHQQLQQMQQLQQQQAQQVPLPQPPQPQAAAGAAAAPAAQVQMPQFHLHMMPAGFMEGAFAAIPVVGFAPFQAGQFPQPARRRFAIPRRAAAAAGVLPVAAAAAAQQLGDRLVQLEAALNEELAEPQQPQADQNEGADPPAVVVGAAALAQDAPDPLLPEQQHLHQRAIRVQVLVGPPQAGIRDQHPQGDADNEHPVMIQDPEEFLHFDEDIFGPLRADLGDEDAADTRRVAGERTPPRDVPARIEDPEAQEMNASCPICILPFKNGADGSRVARVLSCGHLICTGCVKLFCRNLKENRSMAYHSYDRAPCVVCQRPVRWRGLPECKAVGYLYEQLELTNEERNPVDDAAKIRAETRKRSSRHLDNVSSSCHEMATKIRKLVRKADGVYDQSLEMSSHSIGRETMSRIACSEQADWMVKKVEEEAIRVDALEKQFNEYYDKMNHILEEISGKPFNLPKEFPKPEQPSTSS